MGSQAGLFVTPFPKRDLAPEFLENFAGPFGEKIIAQAAERGMHDLFAIRSARWLAQIAQDTFDDLTMFVREIIRSKGIDWSGGMPLGELKDGKSAQDRTNPVEQGPTAARSESSRRQNPHHVGGAPLQGD